ncbi:MAG: hypothetical protein ACKO3R_04490 [bacterium]
MKRIILCLVFLALGSQQSAFAGGLPRPMTDLSSDLRNELERARLNADEYKNLYLDQQAEARKLRTDLDSANQKCNDCYRDKAQLDGSIASLRGENQELNRKVGEYKAKADLLVLTPPVSPEVEAKPEIAKVGEDSSIFHRVFGTLVGVPVGIAAGTPIGAVRGSVSKAITYADGFSEYMGPGLLGEAAGNVSGLGVGAVAGAFSGAAKGFTTGVKYGYLSPFSARSVSLDGAFTNGYNPYDFSDLGV